MLVADNSNADWKLTQLMLVVLQSARTVESRFFFHVVWAQCVLN
jgi:hypothetical protein